MRNNQGEPWYNTEMDSEKLPTLSDLEHYIVSSTCPGVLKVRDYLLSNGELVKGIAARSKQELVRWVRSDGDVYLGVGVEHV